MQLVESNFLGGIDPNICTTGSQSHPPANQDHFVVPVSTISSVEGLSYISKYPIYANVMMIGVVHRLCVLFCDLDSRQFPSPFSPQWNSLILTPPPVI